MIISPCASLKTAGICPNLARTVQLLVWKGRPYPHTNRRRSNLPLDVCAWFGMLHTGRSIDNRWWASEHVAGADRPGWGRSVSKVAECHSWFVSLSLCGRAVPNGGWLCTPLVFFALAVAASASMCEKRWSVLHSNAVFGSMMAVFRLATRMLTGRILLPVDCHLKLLLLVEGIKQGADTCRTCSCTEGSNLEKRSSHAL